LQADNITVVEDGPTLSVKYCLPVPVLHFWPQLMHPAARRLFDSWASCFYGCWEPWLVFVGNDSKVKSLDTELHIATTTLKSLELSESKVRTLLPQDWTISLAG